MKMRGHSVLSLLPSRGEKVEMRGACLSLMLIIILFYPLSAAAYDLKAVCANRERYVPFEERSEKGLLFTIEHCRHPASYIFGTLHTDDPEIIANLKPVFKTASESQLALFELEMGPEVEQQVAHHMLIPGTSAQGLKSIVGTRTFDQLNKEIQSILPQFTPQIVNRYKPWAAAILLQYPPGSGDGVVLDDRLQKSAQAVGIQVRGLEDVEEQFSIFERLSRTDQVSLLRDTLEHMEDIKENNDALTKLYKEHDLKGIGILGEEAFDDSDDPRLQTYLREAVMYRRSENMLERLLPHLKKGKVFTAVGALHLPGKRGILHGLEQEGYFIRVAY